MSEETRIIEINGVKLEVDMRYAKRIDTLRVGSKVKVLLKGDSFRSNTVHYGTVVGFEPFDTLPTIIVAYLDIQYRETELKFAYINKETAEKYDVVPCVDETIPVKRADVMGAFKREEDKIQNDLRDLQQKRDYFERHFDLAFADMKQEAVA